MNKLSPCVHYNVEPLFEKYSDKGKCFVLNNEIVYKSCNI